MVIPVPQGLTFSSATISPNCLLLWFCFFMGHSEETTHQVGHQKLILPSIILCFDKISFSHPALQCNLDATQKKNMLHYDYHCASRLDTVLFIAIVLVNRYTINAKTQALNCSP